MPESGATRLQPVAARLVSAGAVLMLLGVICGAFGAHALQNVLTPKMLAAYQTGVSYHLFHALGAIAVGLVAQVTSPSRWIACAGVLLVAGIVLFSGSLYALALGAPRMLGVVTPLGGLAFM